MSPYATETENLEMGALGVKSDESLKTYANLIGPTGPDAVAKIETILAEAGAIAPWDTTLRREVFRNYQDWLMAEPPSSELSPPAYAFARERLRMFDDRMRAALLLVGSFHFSLIDASIILRIGVDEIRRLFISAIDVVDDHFRLDILHLDADERMPAAVQEALSRHRVVSTQTIASFRDTIINHQFDLIISETETYENLDVVDCVQSLAIPRKIPVLYATLFPERLSRKPPDTPHLVYLIWPPWGEDLRAWVRHVAFWHTFQAIMNPPIFIAFKLPVEKNAPPQHIAEFASRKVPRRLPPPFDWVRRDRNGHHIFLRTDDPRAASHHFPDPVSRDGYDEGMALIEEIIATGNPDILLAALVPLESEVHFLADWAWEEDIGTDRRRHRRMEAMFSKLRSAYRDLRKGEALAAQHRQAHAAQNARLIASDPTSLDSIEWRELEAVVAEVFSKLGFQSRLTSAAADGGRDVVLSYHVGNDRRSVIVELKHWRTGKRVGKHVVAKLGKVVGSDPQTIGLLIATGGFDATAAANLTSLQRRKIVFGDAAFLVQLCHLYVEACSGRWSQPRDLGTILPLALDPD